MSDSDRPVVAVLEGISAGRYFADAALKRGLEPVVIFPKIETSDVYNVMRQSAVDFWTKKGCRVIEPEDDSKETMVRIVKSLNPVAIVSGSELGVPWTDFLTQALNLAGNDPATSLMRRNKYEMQQKLQQALIPSLRSLKCHSLDECVEIASKWNTWPVVVKPLAGAGSLGVHFCHNLKNLSHICQQLFKEQDLFGTANTEILLQEFAHGTEYIVNTMSCAGQHIVTDVWRYDKVPVGSKGNAYNYAALVRQPNETEKTLLSYTLKVLDALGFRYGPSHTELMLIPKGPRLIETAARPMGGFFPDDLMRQIFGFDHASLTLDAVLDPKAFKRVAAKPYAPNTSALLKIVISHAHHPVKTLYYEAIAYEAPVVKRWEFDLVKRSGEIVETIDLETAGGELFIADERAEIVWLAYEAMRRLETDCQEWLYGSEDLQITTPIMHAVGSVPFTEHTVLPWLNVIRHTGAFSRNAQSGTSLMVETDGMTTKEITAFSSLLGIFGWRQIEYGTYYKL